MHPRMITSIAVALFCGGLLTTVHGAPRLDGIADGRDEHLDKRISPETTAQSRQSPPDSATAARIAWLRTHAAALRSIDPADENWNDLEPLRKAIGSARIVFLGEPSHDMGNAFSGQTRLVKFLHQQMGFDVLVFESGLYPVAKVWDAIRAGEPPLQSFQQGIVPAWVNPAEMTPLMWYIAAHAKGPRPLELAGWDPQWPGYASEESLLSELQAFADKLGLSALSDDSLVVAGVRCMPICPATVDSAARTRIARRLGDLAAAIGERSQDLDARFWQHVLASNGAMVSRGASPDSGKRIEFTNVRDQQGARNLAWLADERYRGRKLIVWSATWHAARNVQGLVPMDTSYTYAGAFPLGHHVWQARGPEMYALGFVALEGSIGVKDGITRPILADLVKEVELEEMLGAAGLERAFVDYRTPQSGGEWLRGSFWSRPFGLRWAEQGRWGDVIDGIVFVRKATPTTLRGAHPTREFVRDSLMSDSLPPQWQRTVAKRYSRSFVLRSDTTIVHQGKASVRIDRLGRDPWGSGRIEQSFAADEYRGHRLRLSGYVRTKNAPVGAGLWMRIDGSLSGTPYDNSTGKLIRGTTGWKRMEIVLDVPPDATQIIIGGELSGPGMAWLDDLVFSVVDSTVPATGRTLPARRAVTGDEATGPRNLGFERRR